jgi:hypothetical protein
LGIDGSTNTVVSAVLLGVVQDTAADAGLITIGSLATILTVAGVTIYVLGLVGLAVTIRIRLAKDIPTAWYAVSLLPRAIVAGQGIRIWLGWPLILTVAIALWTFLIMTFELSVSRTLNLALGGAFYAVVIVFFLFLGVFVWRATRPDTPGPKDLAFVRNRTHRFTRTFARMLAIGLFFLVGLLAAAVIAFGSTIMMVSAVLVLVGLGPDRFATGFLRGFFDGIYWIVAGIPVNHLVLAGVITLFIGGFTVGLPAALIMKPPLPQVQLTRRPDAAATVSLDSVTYNLLTHSSDGLWHVFDDTRQLWAIPDEEVLFARIPGVPKISGGPTTPAEQRSPAQDAEKDGSEDEQ